MSKTGPPFDALLCVGQFFPTAGSDVDEVMELIEGQKEMPLPTYFIGDYGEAAGVVLSSAKSKVASAGLIMEGICVCKNLYWLKGSGVFDLHGLRMAYLGGKYVASSYKDAARAQSNGTYHEDDVDALRAFADDPEVIDFFLTNEWPLGILNGVPAPSELKSSVVGSAIVAELAAELKPRYHIAGSEEVFYTRDPYTNEDSLHITRFVGLAAIGNEKKQKYLHALSPTPASAMSSAELYLRPPNTTPSPYKVSKQKGVRNFKTTPKPSLATQGPHESEGQYWRFSAPQSKRQKTGVAGADKVCFEFLSKGSCSRGDACNFKHDTAGSKLFSKGSCFDFVTKGKCERGPDCKFRHILGEENSRTDAAESDLIPNGGCFDFYRKGKCDRGAECRFSHSPNESKIRSSGPCWFCLASPNVEAHLVVSVGEHYYCAIPKGALVQGHVLIIPIQHFPSSVSLPHEAEDELHRYKDALWRMYKRQGNTMLVFERYLDLKAGTHAHLQVVPIPSSRASGASAAFVSAAKELGFSFDVLDTEDARLDRREALRSHLKGGENYFFVELPEGTVIVHIIDPGENMPLQFGREVSAKILGIPERSDWRICKVSKNEETEAAETFKKEFQSYDPAR